MGDGGGGIRWTRISRAGRGQYEAAALMCLCGPVMMGLALFTGADVVIIGIVFTVVFLPLGLGLWGHTVTEREQNRRLDAVGVPAAAEITGLTDFDWHGESPGVEVGLRVSEPGFRTFEMTWHRTNHPGLRAGLRLTAVVDPVGGLFRVDL
ncbi:hypothetical protein EES39_21815 [Streptomyces sp. ADI92-24]|uniref:hypothetical protein n=1 Tax=unclassified Streptomyces TaxID=2593676 RepID=UPI000F559714|nr:MULTISPECIES: hypothetical protein [unclassified Streptomyces]MCX4769305.1 hypothetical protein [Streptomyces sp. NBC_01285]RPK41888.1 hypothetical protein EES39_21815 [Streptomyces sp. ADI92-24]